MQLKDLKDDIIEKVVRPVLPKALLAGLPSGHGNGARRNSQIVNRSGKIDILQTPDGPFQNVIVM